jgi:zinc protease
MKRFVKQLTVACAGVVGVVVSAGAQAQVSPRAADTSTVTYEVGGIRVIHRPSPTDIVVANLYLLGGVRQVTFANAGIEPFLLQLTERGTRSYPRERLRKQMAQLGTAITINATKDWTQFGLRSTRETFDSTWAILTSRLMEPSLEASQVELVRRQLLLGVSQRQDSPDALLEFLADSVAYAGHAYAIPEIGTSESLARISQADLRAYHAAQFVKSRMLLVVVGGLTRETIQRVVTRTLARLPAGAYVWSAPDTLPRRKAAAFVVPRDLPTNYIMGRYAGPRAGTRDYYAMQLASAVYSGQLFSEIRSRRNLTYAVDAPFIDRAVSGGGMYVTTVSPQLTVDIMRQQLATMRTGTVDASALHRLVQQFLTQFFLENETNTEQADFLTKSFLYEGDIRAVGRFEQQLRQVTPDDIQRVSQRWIRDVQWVFVGDSTKAPRASMERF